MPTENDPMATMTRALAQMYEDFGRATHQAVQLRNVMEGGPPEHAPRAMEQVDGTSYVQVLQRTIRALDEMPAAYGWLRTTIVKRAGGRRRNRGRLTAGSG